MTLRMDRRFESHLCLKDGIPTFYEVCLELKLNCQKSKYLRRICKDSVTHLPNKPAPEP
jgi:hypothetical protein